MDLVKKLFEISSGNNDFISPYSLAPTIFILGVPACVPGTSCTK